MCQMATDARSETAVNKWDRDAQSSGKPSAIRYETPSNEADLRAQFERDVVPLREPLYRRALRLSRHQADAQDLVQDTMVQAYASFRSFRPGSSLHAWLYQIQMDVYIDGYRKRLQQPTQYSMGYITDQQLLTFAQQASKELSSAEDEVLTALRNNEIREAMRALPEQLRAAVYYADVEGLSYRKIAEMTGISVGTVSSRLARGRRHLRKLLDDGFPGRRPQLQAS